MRHISLCAALLFLTSVPAAFAANPVTFFGQQKVPLLYQIFYSSPTDEAPGALQTNVQQVYIFRDGTVLVSVSGVTESLEATGGILSGQAPAISMQGLNETLEGIQVGTRRDCQLDLPEFTEHVHLQYTWFGKERRKNTFKVSDVSDGPGVPCPELRLLQVAIASLLGSTTFSTGFGQ